MFVHNWKQMIGKRKIVWHFGAQHNLVDVIDKLREDAVEEYKKKLKRMPDLISPRKGQTLKAVFKSDL